MESPKNRKELNKKLILTNEKLKEDEELGHQEKLLELIFEYIGKKLLKKMNKKIIGYYEFDDGGLILNDKKLEYCKVSDFHNISFLNSLPPKYHSKMEDFLDEIFGCENEEDERYQKIILDNTKPIIEKILNGQKFKDYIDFGVEKEFLQLKERNHHRSARQIFEKIYEREIYSKEYSKE